jgi:hypothetical protein
MLFLRVLGVLRGERVLIASEFSKSARLFRHGIGPRTGMGDVTTHYQSRRAGNE